MVVLKRIKASTLMETLVATVLLIVIFIITSLTVNRLFGNTIIYDTHAVHQYIHELEYRYQHRQLQLPYAEAYENWELSVYDEQKEEVPYIIIKAVHTQHHKTIIKPIISHVQKP